MESEAKRYQIVALNTVGISNSDTTKQLGVCRKTVFNVWKRYTETLTAKRSIRSNAIVQVVMKRVKRNLRKSMRKTASQLRISRSSYIQDIFKII